MNERDTTFAGGNISHEFITSALGVFGWHDELFWFLAAFALPAWLAFVCLGAQRSRAEHSLGWMLVTQCLWVFGQSMELAAHDARVKLWLDGLQYFPMCAGFACAVVFAHHFSGTPLNRWVLSFYCFVALPGCLFYASAPLHGLARQDAHLIGGVPFDTLMYKFTSGDHFLILSGFAANTYATFVAARRLRRVRSAYVASSVPVLLGLALPTLAVVPALVFDWRIFGQRDVSFAVFGVSGLFMLWGLRNGRAAVVPLARDLLFDRSPDPAFVVDQHGVVLELNSAAARLLQIEDNSEALSMPLTEAIVRALRTSEPLEVHTTANRTLRVRSHHIPDLDVHLIVARDVTDEVNADELRRERQANLEQLVKVRSHALHATELKFQAVFERSFEMMFLLSSDGKVLDANRAATADCPREQLIGAPLWASPWVARTESVQKQLRDAIHRAAFGEQIRLPVLLVGQKDTERAMDFSLTPIAAHDNEPTLLICEGRDVTELRRVEEHLRQASKMEALGTLAGGVAHDFNNILTVILGNIGFLRSQTQDEAKIEALDEVDHAATHAAALTQQLLAFGRKSMLISKELDLRSELSAAVRMLSRVIPADISVNLDVDDGVGSIVFDSSQLHQIVLNLAINARDAMPYGGELHLSAVSVRRTAPNNPETRDWVLLTIRDTGVGMNDETRARIFEPFFTTKEPGRGTGLGLAMVYGAIMQHGGFMEVTSEPERGTAFALYLKQEHSARTTKPATSGIREASPRGVIYLVDDQAPVLRAVATSLERAGHSVKTFGSASELLEHPALMRPDVLLTDAIMPRMSGFELVRRLRSRWANLPCVVMSGYSDENLVQTAQAQGVLFVRKPFVGDELQHKVREALARRGGEDVAVVNF